MSPATATQWAPATSMSCHTDNVAHQWYLPDMPQHLMVVTQVIVAVCSRNDDDKQWCLRSGQGVRATKRSATSPYPVSTDKAPPTVTHTMHQPLPHHPTMHAVSMACLIIFVLIVHKEYPHRLPFMGFIPAQPSWNLYLLNTHTRMQGHRF